MPTPPRASHHLLPSDARAALRLLSEGTRSVNRMAEGVHRAVQAGMGLPVGAAPGRTRGLTGWVYRSVDAVDAQISRHGDAALQALEALLPPASARGAASAQRGAVLAALNGVMGDRLAAQGSPLATSMGLWHAGQQWRATQPVADARATVVVMLHGLCMHDGQWSQPCARGRVNHGLALAAALDAMPLFLRYNSGLHVSDNGTRLAALLEQVQQHWPVPITRLVLLGHSMGGLVARSAVHAAQQQGLAWPSVLRQMVFLGTPHLGAPLEQAGHGLQQLLGSSAYSAPFVALARLRSAGITDLRHGHVRATDWQAQDRFADALHLPLPLPLPTAVDCYAIAATLSTSRGLLADRLLGDGLVPLHSALGQHAQTQRALAFAPQHQRVLYRTGHLALLSSAAVQTQLRRWLV